MARTSFHPLPGATAGAAGAWVNVCGLSQDEARRISFFSDRSFDLRLWGPEQDAYASYPGGGGVTVTVLPRVSVYARRRAGCLLASVLQVGVL